jgi:hypothetical protein
MPFGLYHLFNHFTSNFFEFLVMPFRLMNASTTFQAPMNDMLDPYLREFVLIFFDDILVYNSSWLEHLHHLHLVFTKL